MKLFRVEVTKVIYMLAEDEGYAALDGPMHAMEEHGDGDVFVTEAENLQAVEEDWRDALPYGGEGDQTIRQYFNQPEEPKPFVDPPEQKKLW